MTPDWSRREVMSAAALALLAGCGESDPVPTGTPTATPTASPTPVPDPEDTPTPRQWEAPADAPATEVDRNVMVENLEVPWDIAIGDNGDVFVSERVGRVNHFDAGDIEEVVAPDDAIDAGSIPPGSDERPWWVKGGEGGTLGIALHPSYPDVALLYVYYTAEVDGDTENRVSWFDISADDPAATETVVVEGIPADNIHNGGRLEFGPEGYLWITTGDAGQEERADDPAFLGGKILRVTVRGEAAPGNPDLGGDPRVFTLGHRNPQGIVWLPDNTTIASEHGPSAKDEINRIVGGDDYGWPDARTEVEYRAALDVHPPLANTGNVTWAPTGSLFYTGDAVPSWQNRMLVGGLVSQRLHVVTLTPPDAEAPPADSGRVFDAGWLDDAYTVTATPVLEDVLGRIRHVEQGPDGELYAITSNRDGRAKDPFPRERDDVLVRLEAP